MTISELATVQKPELHKENIHIYFEKIDRIFGGRGSIPMEGTTITVTNSFGAVENEDAKPPGVCTVIF